MVLDIQFDTVMKILEPKISPAVTLRKYQSLCRRSPQWSTQNSDMPYLIKNIEAWIASPKASLLVLHASPRSQLRARGIATELVSLLEPTAKQVAWHLADIGQRTEEASVSEIFKSLVCQLLSLDAQNMVKHLKGNLTAAKLQERHSNEEWVDLVCLILRHISACYIIVEAPSTVDPLVAIGRDSQHCHEIHLLFQRLVDKAEEVGCRIRILLIIDGVSAAGSHATPFKMIRLQPPATVAQSRRNRHLRTSFRSPAWQNLKHKVQ